MNFMKLQPQEIQWIYDFYQDSVNSGLTPQQITLDMASELTSKFHFSEAVSSKVATKLVSAFSAPDFTSLFIETIISSALTDDTTTSAATTPPDSATLRLTQFEYNTFLSRVNSDPLMTPELASLLLSFLAFYRHSFHPSGWIRYEKKNVFHLAGLSRLPIQRQEALTRYLHSRHGLDMRVVGSNQPIPCFGISWLEAQPLPGSDENPLITIGSFLPETIRAEISKITFQTQQQ